MDLVEDDELVEVGGQERFSVLQARTICGRLEVEIDAGAAATKLQGEGGLPALTRPEESHGRRLGETFEDTRLESATKHPGN
jgi:hypothetical protein